MSETIITDLVSVILEGGPEVTACLLLFIIMMLFDRRRLLKESEKRDKHINKIVDDYHRGVLAIASALNALATTLAELKSHM